MKQINMAASYEALTASEQTIGCAGDHLSTELHVALQPELQGEEYTYRLAFCTADGYGCFSELLTPQNGELIFALPNVLMVEGQLQVQLIVYQREVIAHTPKSAALCVLPSIVASTDIPTDYTGLIYPGVGIESTAVVDGHLIVRYQDGTEQDAGKIEPELPAFSVEKSEFWQSMTFPKTTVMRFDSGAQVQAENGLEIACGADVPLDLNGVQVSSNTSFSILNFKLPTTIYTKSDLVIQSDASYQVNINGVAFQRFGKIDGLSDPKGQREATNKRYVDNAIATINSRWKNIVDATFDSETGESTLMLELDPSVAQMEEFKMAVILPLKDGVSAGGFYIKAFLTDEAVSDTNTLFSRSAVAVTAGGRMLVSSYSTRMGDGLLYTTDGVYTNTNNAKTPYTALQMFDVSLLEQKPYLRVTLTGGKCFEEGTQIILQGR